MSDSFQKILEQHLADVAHWKAAEEALQREKIFTNAVLDSVPGLLYLYDEEGRLVRWNKRHEEMTGCSTEELADKHVTDWFRGEEVEYLKRKFQEALVEGFTDGEGTLVAKNGAKIPFYFTGVRLILDGKKYVAGIGIDIARRKAVEESLRQSEYRYHSLFEQMNEGFALHEAVFDPQGKPCDYRFLEVNPAFEQITGLTRDAVIGRTMLEALPGKSADLLDRFDEAATTGQSVRFERYVEELDKHFDLSVYNPVPGQFAVIFSDVTASRKAQEAIRKSETFYRTLFQSAYDAIFLMRDNVFIDCNPTTLRMFGHPREELVGHFPYEFSPPRQSDGRDSRELAIEKIQAALDGKPQFFGWTHRRADGSLIFTEVSLNRIDVSGETTILAIVRDVTERKKAEESLRKLSQAVEQSPVNVAITDLDGNIEYANSKFCQITGYSLEEAIGKNPRILKSGHTSDEEYRVLWETLRAGGVWSGEFLNKAKDGSLFWEQARITSIKDENGQITHFLAVKEDITERKKAEEKLDGMRLQLTHVARLSTLGEMAAELAHELNHPLYAILNYAKASRNLLSEEGPTDLNSLREWNEEIAVIAASAGEVVKRLKSFAGRADSSRSACRVEEIVEQALRLFAVELRIARVTVETSFAALPAIQADRVQIQQVLVNLLGNAVEAMETVPADMRRIAVQTVARGAEVEIVVSDQGIGLPPDAEKKIFEPFVSTKQDGLGMGLCIARTIVDAHGGRLWATSNPEKGAAFHFTLPFQQGGAAHEI
jgi:PAS domain S-box-containing protein